MKNLGVSGSLIALLPMLLGGLLVTTRTTVAEEGASAQSDGPLLIAQLPEMPDTKTRTYEFRYQLKRGDVLRYEVTHRASIRSTIDQTTQAAQTKTDSVKVWKVTDVLPDGDIEFMNVVERVRMVNQLPERDAVEYDSLRDKTPPPGFADAARAVGVPLSIVRMTPHGKVVRREMKVRGQGAEEDAPIALRLPDEPVAIGDTWDEPFEVQVSLPDGGSKTIETRRHHKLAGVKNGIATIEVTYQVLSPIDSHIETQIVQRLMEGEVRFDIKAGRVVGQQMDIDKRIIGFAGPTSSMQYIMRMEENLLTNEPKVAVKPTRNTTASNRRPTAKITKRPTANRPRTAQPSSKSYRR